MDQIIPQAQKKAVQEKLTQFSREFKNIKLVTLASIDGFALASAGSQARHSETPERFAAMASSMAALAQAAGKEFEADDFEVALLDFRNMYLAYRGIKTPSASFVLAVVIEHPENLGTFSKGLRACAKFIETVLKNPLEQITRTDLKIL
jgi:predicted regulator of Ras-like GTPase activity (Roadblock/LC7/MglB family)